MNFRKQKGFTLIEILVVIGILAILLAIVLVAVNPQQQFQKANNTQRSSDVAAILDAVSAYASDNKGALPTGIDNTVKTITSDTGVGNVDLCDALVPDYIADLPIDPTAGDEDPAGSVCTAASATYNSGYTITSTGASGGNRITVTAPSTEGTGPDITVTR